MLNEKIIRKISPYAADEIVAGIVDNATMFEEFGLTHYRHVAYFMGRAAVETGGFRRLEENLYYTKTATLRRVWPTRFKTDEAALPYLKNPEKLANFVYGGRFGNNQDGDGWNYRGGGIHQVTFKANYAEVEKETGIPCVQNPNLLREFPGALVSALVYWRNRNLNKFAEKNDIVGLCKAIQGGDGGLSDQRLYTDRALIALAREYEHGGQSLLKKGSRGGDVVELQRLLQSSGFYDDEINGVFDDGLENAVIDYQKSNGLIPDGVVGKNTWKVLTS